jgi:hypothetical protein
MPRLRFDDRAAVTRMADVAETPGVYHPAWSIEQLGADIDAIRNTGEPVVVPSGHVEHLRYSFGMATRG